LKRMKREAIDELPLVEDFRGVVPEVSGDSPTPMSLVVLRTILIWFAFVLVMAGFYFVMSWTPKLLVHSGMSAAQGITGGVLLNAGGIIGCTLFSVISSRGKLRTLLTAVLVVSALLLVTFGAKASDQQIAMPLAVALGAAITACVGGLYSLTPLLYPPKARATGVGWAVGMGRLGAIVAPVLVGTLMDHGWQVEKLYYLFSVPFLLAVIPVIAIFFSIQRRVQWRQTDIVETV
jgi:MFS family permease